MSQRSPLSATDFYLLLAFERVGKLWGYALLEEMARLSDGAVRPDIGSLYRTLGRLMAAGLLHEAGEGEPLRGKKRRYYRITAAGRRALCAEAERLRRTVDLLEESQLLPARV